MNGRDVAFWPEASVRCLAAMRPKSGVKPTCQDSSADAFDPQQTLGPDWDILRRMVDSCAPPPLFLPPRSDRLPLIREAFGLEWLTIGWMTVEAVVAVGAGVTAGSLVLVAFGLDSVIELASAGVLMWRLSVELRHGQKFSEVLNASPVASAARCCSPWRPTLWQRPYGNYGTELAINSLGRASSSR